MPGTVPHVSRHEHASSSPGGRQIAEGSAHVPLPSQSSSGSVRPFPHAGQAGIVDP
jgi:hypothetical protein